MTLTLDNETELIEGCRAGKEAARKELYVRYAKQMLAVCYRYTGGECSLKSWLTRVMMTQSIDFLRQRERFARLVVYEEQLPDCADEEPVAGSEADSLSQEVLMELLAGLPTGCRTVFNLYVFEEKSHQEIASLLGIKEHTSTSQLHRAKLLLAKKIKEYIEHENRR